MKGGVHPNGLNLGDISQKPDGCFVSRPRLKEGGGLRDHIVVDQELFTGSGKLIEYPQGLLVKGVSGVGQRV